MVSKTDDRLKDSLRSKKSIERLFRAEMGCSPTSRNHESSGHDWWENPSSGAVWPVRDRLSILTESPCTEHRHGQDVSFNSWWWHFPLPRCERGRGFNSNLSSGFFNSERLLLTHFMPTATENAITRTVAVFLGTWIVNIFDWATCKLVSHLFWSTTLAFSCTYVHTVNMYIQRNVEYQCLSLEYRFFDINTIRKLIRIAGLSHRIWNSLTLFIVWIYTSGFVQLGIRAV